MSAKRTKIAAAQPDWYVYIARCADDTLYTGITTELERRIAEHNSNTAKSARYTRSRQPVALVYSEKINNRAMASRRENEIKKLSRTEKLQLISKYNSAL